jgi:hypothetical protein
MEDLNIFIAILLMAFLFGIKQMSAALPETIAYLLSLKGSKKDVQLKNSSDRLEGQDDNGGGSR